MPKRFYKHKLLLDEHLPPRQRLAHLNERFDVNHIKHDLRAGGMDDVPIHELALAQQRIILTSNVKDFRRLLREDSPGVISIPETWSTVRLDTKLVALLRRHSPACTSVRTAVPGTVTGPIGPGLAWSPVLCPRGLAGDAGGVGPP